MYSTSDLCSICTSDLTLPYIECAECSSNITICTFCFSKGMETNEHSSDHKYKIVNNNFCLLSNGWSAKEELMLLDAVIECGYGNWSNIAELIPNKSARQCQNHYTYYYVDSPIPELKQNMTPDLGNVIHPSPLECNHCEDPPRPSNGSLLYSEMSGYNAARGDFSLEFDNYAEEDVKNIEFDEFANYEDNQLKLAVIDIYRSKLLERFRRKKLVKHYGLINHKKTTLFDRQREMIFSKYEKLKVFSKIMSPFEFEIFIESWMLEHELKSQIKRLKEYREAGITKFISAKVYLKLKASHMDSKCKRSLLTDVLNNRKLESSSSKKQDQALFDFLAKGNGSLPNMARKAPPPLDIESLPGQEMLNDREKQLCQAVRLIPKSYLDFKRLMINENNKLGGLKLAQARHLVKIDVNKTRKIFDFLINENLITKIS